MRTGQLRGKGILIGGGQLQKIRGIGIRKPDGSCGMTGMKKSTQIYYIVILTVMILVPVAFFAVFGKYFDTTNYENRDLAKKPVLSLDTIDSFPSDYETWFNDHLPFRNQLLTLNGWIDYHYLHTSSSDTVIVGKDGWLFYSGSAVNGEDPVADYMGTNLFTEEELQTIAKNMTDTEAYLKARGCQFYIFLCPNKERVYSEYMPDAYGEPAARNRLKQVTEYLKAHTDIPVISAYEDIMAYKQEHPEQRLYYKYDTHWNDIGAYVGTKALTTAMGFDQVPLSECTVEDAGESTFDLARMIHLSTILTKDGFYTITGYTPHNIQISVNDTATQYVYKTDSTAPGERLFVIGDSFSSMSAYYYGCHFQDTFTTFYYEYELSQLEEKNPTVLVYECVERYLGNMLRFSITDGIEAEQENG